MAMVFVSTAAARLHPARRRGLEAIVPKWFPAPRVAVAVSGAGELLLAACLIPERTRRAAAILAISLLLVLFSANVKAARGVCNPDAPSTPLGPRALLQAIFIGSCAVAASKT